MEMELLWRVMDREGDFVKPLEFEGKNQADVVRDIIEAFESYDVVFLKSPTGTGKSLIAMEVIANAFDGGIIVVPTKHLQKQYYNDFGPGGKFKIPGIDIRFILGRNNFICPKENVPCSYSNLPCIRKLENGETRYDVASKCKFWCPRYPADFENIIAKIERKLGKRAVEYMTFSGDYVIFYGENDCPYLKQYRAYAEANVIVMNDKLWLIETLAKRKPKFFNGIEVWDECDNLIQQFSSALIISRKKYGRFFDEKIERMWKKIIIAGKNVSPDFVFKFLVELMRRIGDDEESESLKLRIKRILDEFDDYVIRIEKEEEKIYFFVKDVKKYVKKILKACNDKILGMSATLQDDYVLQNYYGFRYKIIHGRKKYPGKIYLLKTKRWWINHSRWEEIEDEVNEEVCRVLNEAERFKLKTLIQVHSFKYIRNLPVRIDSSNENGYENWMNGEFLTLASTRLKRGADLKDDLCRVLCILKMPYPDKSDLKIKHLFETLPESLAKAVYKDMARRELIQQIGRALRHDKDWVILACFDKIALEYLKKENLWDMEEIEEISSIVK